MFIAKPMADEFCRGHAGRLRLLKQLKDHSTSKAHQIYRTNDADHPPSFIATTANLLKMPLIQYVSLHSLLPLSHAVIPEDSEFLPLLSPQILRKRGMMPLRKGGYFCGHCIDEDLNFWGFSYWRRSHQIPGLHWCEKHHKNLLVHVPRSDVFDFRPDFWHRQNKFTFAPQAEELKKSKTVHILVEALQTILETPIKENSGLVRISLDKKLNRFTSHKSIYRQDTIYFSDLIFAQYPKSFLKEIVPRFHTKQPNEYFGPLDGLVRQKSLEQFQSTLLVMFSLFISKSTDEALRIFSNLSTKKLLKEVI
ncbi:TniQ family protein [Polynucleobacter sp. Tro8-14-1]|uniref:TniQ family protein n=1 Tax=Polynucleobacter sp. Tro8-14-1 TaxID=1758383 RepID=UPI001C0AF984|nr:TniQ family protein [Polynucleobacter sp. Tro8-14-1]MBU3562200.1 hypothetical protein [Polynucleobacter sp. Tro8-14-1]